MSARGWGVSLNTVYTSLGIILFGVSEHFQLLFLNSGGAAIDNPSRLGAVMIVVSYSTSFWGDLAVFNCFLTF